jgi:hypothetical protein
MFLVLVLEKVEPDREKSWVRLSDRFETHLNHHHQCLSEADTVASRLIVPGVALLESILLIMLCCGHEHWDWIDRIQGPSSQGSAEQLTTIYLAIDNPKKKFSITQSCHSSFKLVVATMFRPQRGVCRPR